MLEALAELFWDGAWRIAVLSAVLGALLWGWFALTLSPIERYYFPAYVGSSLHIANGPEPDQIAWLVKTRAKNKFEIADASDVMPIAHGAIPFVLSPQAMQQGWTRAKILRPLDYQAGSQRAILQDSFFGGQSLGLLLFQPMEILALPLVLWTSFVRWRYKREQDRPPVWAWNYRKTSRADDITEFTGELFRTVKFCAVSGWRWTQAKYTVVRTRQESGSVSSSVTAAPEKKATFANDSKPITVAASRLHVVQARSKQLNRQHRKLQRRSRSFRPSFPERRRYRSVNTRRFSRARSGTSPNG